MKLYTVMTDAGSPAILAKIWTRAGCYRATVPVKDPSSSKLGKIKSDFSSIRSNFTGLNEDDWISFDSLLEQLNTKETRLDQSLTLALSLASARAATKNDLWKIVGQTSKFPHIVGIMVKGSAWRNFMLIPYRERNVEDAFRMLSEVSEAIGHELDEKGVLNGRGPDGAWVTDLGDTGILHLIGQVASDWRMAIGVDVGAGSIWDGTHYDYTGKGDGVVEGKITPEDQLNLLSALMEHYKIDYIEDPFNTTDFMLHAKLSQKFNTMVAGGDLYGSDASRMRMAYKYRPTNTVSVTPSSLATVSHLSRVYDFARAHGIRVVMSRSVSDTGDDWVSDLSVAFRADMIKLGVTGASNTLKYGRLMEIWEETHSPKLGSR